MNKIIQEACFMGEIVRLAMLTLAVSLFSGIFLMAEEYTRITSDGKLIIDYKRNAADFYDNVFVKSSKGTIKSDRLKIFFDKTGNAIEKMIADGHVSIDQMEHHATCGTAEYFSAENKLVLTDGPVITKGPNTYTADKIIIDMNTSKVYFEPSARIVMKKE